MCEGAVKGAGRWAERGGASGCKSFILFGIRSSLFHVSVCYCFMRCMSVCTPNANFLPRLDNIVEFSCIVTQVQV